MIPYQLPSGKTVFVDPINLLDAPDYAVQDLIADDSGVYLDPFSSSKSEKSAVVSFEQLPDLSDIEEVDIDEED